MSSERGRRHGVEDRWYNRRGEPTLVCGAGKRWRARLVDDDGTEHSRRFTSKAEASAWLDEQVTAVHTGKFVAPRNSRRTLAAWCDQWWESFDGRDTTRATAASHLTRIKDGLGHVPLAKLGPAHVTQWMRELREAGVSRGYRNVLHSRLSQICEDACDAQPPQLKRNPCSRKTSPGAAPAKDYVASHAQVRTLIDAVEEWQRPALLVGAYAGLRIGEACGLRLGDIDFDRAVIHVRQQYAPVTPDNPHGGRELKTDASAASVPIPRALAEQLREHARRYGGTMLVARPGKRDCPPNTIERAVRTARAEVPGLDPRFTFHDLRAYYASVLVDAKLPVKEAQARLRHGSAKTTLDVYARLLEDTGDETRDAIAAAMGVDFTDTGGNVIPLRR